MRAARTWLPVWRSRAQRQSERLWQSAWLLVGPLLGYLSVAVSAIQLYSGRQVDGIYAGLALTFIGIFAIVMRNSWNLLFEIAAEKHKG